MNAAIKPVNRAVAALNSLLTQTSAIHLEEIGIGWPLAGRESGGGEIDILAHLEIFGRSHTVACQITGGSTPEDLRMALEQLRAQIAFLPGRVTPVLILAVLSPEAQTICEENNAGCLDLHGNGRLAIDEIFVSMRSLPRRALHQAASTSATTPRRPIAAQRGAQPATHSAEAELDQRPIRGFPTAHAQAAVPNRPAASSGQNRAS